MNNDYWFVGSHFQDFIINNKYFFSSCLNKLLFFNKLKSWLMNLENNFLNNNFKTFLFEINKKSNYFFFIKLNNVY